MISYTTRAGDTFDILALDFYNDEFKANRIIEANPQYRDIVVFGTGTKLIIPQIEQTAPSVLPPWKR